MSISPADYTSVAPHSCFPFPSRVLSIVKPIPPTPPFSNTCQSCLSLPSSVPVGRLPACCPLMFERKVAVGEGTFGVERPPTARPFNALADYRPGVITATERHHRHHSVVFAPPLDSTWFEVLGNMFLHLHTFKNSSAPPKLSDCQMKLAAFMLHRQGHQPLPYDFSLAVGGRGCRSSILSRLTIRNIFPSSSAGILASAARVNVEASWSWDLFCRRRDKINCK